MFCLQCKKIFDPCADASMIRGIEKFWEMFCSDECLKAHRYFTKHPWPTQEKYPYCHACDDHHGPEGGKSTKCSNFNPHLSEEDKMALKTREKGHVEWISLGETVSLEGAETRVSLLPEVKTAIIALPPFEQQQLYEFMHNSLNLRIR
ncbi:hypothetical protein LCGC14_2369200 [marine sediment metagenome]|uniref:Uncharacterized protein n=1 Tax=marine sediment metagenome TaxID=412755 RepID=A0A0F9CRG2_9ZZZZ